MSTKCANLEDTASLASVGYTAPVYVSSTMKGNWEHSQECNVLGERLLWDGEGFRSPKDQAPRESPHERVFHRKGYEDLIVQ